MVAPQASSRQPLRFRLRAQALSLTSLCPEGSAASG